MAAEGGDNWGLDGKRMALEYTTEYEGSLGNSIPNYSCSHIAAGWPSNRQDAVPEG